MSQATDYVLSNQSGASFRAELNTILAAIASANSGATAPTTTYAYMLWADESSGILKQRNAANNAWIDILILADGSVIDSSITTAKIADDAVTTAKILNANVTQAKLAANVAGTGAAFSAYAASSQSVTSGVITKVNFTTENYDTNSNFASSRFTPTVAGYYLINATLRGTATNLATLALDFYKNGALSKRGALINIPAATVQLMASSSDIFYMNGSTDYLEIYGTVVGTTPQLEFISATNTSTFSGLLVRAA